MPHILLFIDILLPCFWMQVTNPSQNADDKPRPKMQMTNPAILGVPGSLGALLGQGYNHPDLGVKGLFPSSNFVRLSPFSSKYSRASVHGCNRKSHRIEWRMPRMRGHLSILHGEVLGPILKIGAVPRGGSCTCQTFMAYPIDMP